VTFSTWLERTAVPWFTSLGLTKRTVTLEVAGRKSGKLRKVTVATIKDDAFSYLVSVHGESQWVRNVRAAHGRATIHSGRRIPVLLHELSIEDRAPILQDYVSKGAFGRSAVDIARQFGVEPTASIEQMDSLAEHHPVFKIEQLR
jgi:deazaflavin-dependent oxidoreductase (nitroreductase family)